MTGPMTDDTTYIDDGWRDPARLVEVLNPADGSAVGAIGYGGAPEATRADEIGAVLARESGKRLPEAAGEVRFAAEYFRWFGEQARRPAGEVIPGEVFGPAAAVFRFSGEEEAIALANSTEMGLAAYLYTTDLGRADRVAGQLEAGIIGVNDPLPSAAFAPMGGVKQSGLGREGGWEGLAEFQTTHYTATVL